MAEQDLLRSSRRQEVGSQMQQEEQADVYKSEPTVVSQTGGYIPALDTILTSVNVRGSERERVFRDIKSPAGCSLFPLSRLLESS